MAVLIVCATALPIIIFAQPPSIDRKPVNVPSRFIWGITKADDGFHWIASQNGLYRYDGHLVVEYNNLPSNPNHISSNSVFKVFPTRDSKLVIYNHLQTVDILDLVSNSLVTIDLSKKTKRPSDIRMAHQDQNGQVFFITENDDGYSLFKYDGNGFQLLWEIAEKRPTNPLLTDTESPRFQLVCKPNGLFLLHDREKGLMHLDANGKLLYRFSKKEEIGTGELVNFLSKDGQGRIWMASTDTKGIFLFNPKTKDFELDRRFPKKYFYLKIWEDEKGNLLFLASENGKSPAAAFLLNEQGEVTDFSKNLDLTDNIRKVFGNDFQQFFFQVTPYGVFKTNPNQVAIKSYPQNWEGEAISMRGMADDGQGNMLIGTEDKGWFLLDKTTGKVGSVPFESFDNQELMPVIATRNMVNDQQGHIWSIAYGDHKPPTAPHGFLLRYDCKTGQVKSFRCTYRAETLCVAKSGLIYLASIWTLQIFDPATALFSTPTDSLGRNPLEGLSPSCMLQTSNDLIWIGTEKGLVKLDPATNEFLLLKNTGRGSRTPFSSNTILSIAEDESGQILLGTEFGLNIFDPMANKVTVFTKKDGLADNKVCGILVDKTGNLWCSTYNGLSYFDAENRSFRNFFKTDGFNDNEFNRHAFFRDGDGTYYFGGMNGFNSFKAQGLLAERPKPKIMLSEISFFEENNDSLLTRTNNLQALKSITLPATDRYLQARFALDDLTHSELNRYEVFLEGYDREWVQLGALGEVRYNNLPPGQYHLKIRGANSNGLLSENTLNLPVYVGQYFYKTTWFLMICLLIVGSLIAGWIWRLRTEKNRLEAEVEKRTRQIREDKEALEKQSLMLQELNRMKSRFFTNVSHELRTPLTLILSPLQRILKNRTLSKETIHQHLELMEKNGRQLHSRIDELLELSRLDAGKTILRERPVELHSFLLCTLARFEPLAQQKGLALSLDWPLQRELNVLLDESKFEKIIGNLVGNAVKFTSNGVVKLELEKLEIGQRANGHEQHNCLISNFQFLITDTGKGIPPDDLPHIFDRYFQTKNETPTAGGTGIGLSMAKEYAELMGGQTTVKSEVGKGSVFTLKLPIKLLKDKQFFSDNQNVTSNGELPSSAQMVSKIAQKASLPNHPAIQPSNKPTILLAEDNHDLRQYLETILSPYYQVIAVENGLQAWELLTSESNGHSVSVREGQFSPSHPLTLSPVSLILSDVMMPEMDGFTLLEKVKAEERLRRIPFVMLTAKAGIENRLHALRFGVDDYLLKPFAEEELLARIANLLANQRMRLEFLEKENNETQEVGPAPETGWLQQVENLARTSLSDPLFSMDFLAEKMDMSRSSFYRRIKLETGLKPSLYLREVRLQEARRLLENGQCRSVIEASQQVGFQKRAYFSSLFAERFGQTPFSFFEKT